MGIELWERHAANPVVRSDVQGRAPAKGSTNVAGGRMPGAAEPPVKLAPATLPPPISKPHMTGDVAAMDWETLERTVLGCTRCALHLSRTQAVFGVGNHNAQWMVIGEAPGADEDRQGEPFVGRAGQLLNSMLKAIGLAREEVHITNIVRCRPPGNRDPLPEEAATCEPYLKRQIELIKPRIILALGRIAAQNLLKTDIKIGALRGKRHVYPGTEIPLVVTYHPAYLLRSPLEKRKAWDDLQLARRVAQEVSM
ncbi:MAG: uracil-DNA glycosylase, partial [Gammaproteobacteria bacterium]|nr:uracil-DNA glycosylase [Gammaproteobacteria bacterium]